MIYIKRTIEEDLMRQTPSKAVVIYGARRTGKTTVLRELLKNEDVVWYSGDEPDDREMLRLNSASDVKALLTRTRFLVIDEAQGKCISDRTGSAAERAFSTVGLR